MPPHRPTLPAIPRPSRTIFDPYNSTSTGHQRAESNVPSNRQWHQEVRVHKLSHQLGDVSGGGGKTMTDDGLPSSSSSSSSSLPARRLDNGRQDIRDFMTGVRKRKRLSEDVQRKDDDCGAVTPAVLEKDGQTSGKSAEKAQLQQDIFRGLTMYLNGSTAPLVSDHKLKQLFVQHGGQSAIGLARRTVTHVIIGEARTGGGLASGKIEREISNVAGKSIKYVTAQWVLDSVARCIRQPEARYAPTRLSRRISGHGQRSVRAMFLS